MTFGENETRGTRSDPHVGMIDCNDPQGVGSSSLDRGAVASRLHRGAIIGG
jgi:hypothetical protein